jgi:RNA polymerase sigma-70 factor (ECF subfamily)
MVDSTKERFGRLLDEHGSALRRLVAASEFDVGEREDLMQEIAFGLWRALPTFRGECSERTFVFRIANNIIISHGRRSATRRRAIKSGLDESAADAADPHPGPEQQVLSAGLHEQLLKAIQELSPALRQTVILSLEGLTHREIAEVLGTNSAAIGVRLSRARDALTQLLAGVP